MLKGLINILRPPKRRRFLTGIAIALLVGVASSAAFCLDFLHSTQLRSSDFLFWASIPRNQELGDNIVIVGIDDQSLDELGRFSSWPRSYYADLIDALAQAQSRVIVFDVLFSEPGLGDERLAASVKNAGNVVLPVVQTPTVANSTVANTASRLEFLRPLVVLEENAAAVGHANVFPDQDGVVRRLPVAIANGEDYEAALALAAVAKYLRRDEVLEGQTEKGVLPFAGRSIPTGEDNGMLINYASNSVGSGAMPVPVVSFVDVLTGQLDSNLFQDKIVIIGATASGLGDKYWTPLGQMMSGVEIHAHAINTVLTGDFLKPVPSVVTITSILVLALLCGLVAWYFRPLWATVSAVLLCIVYLLAVSACFDEGLVLDMLYPPLSLAGTFVAMNLYNVVSEQSQRRELTKTFGRYVSGAVAAKVLAAIEQGELNLGGQEEEVTVAFADVRGFTSLSETMPPEELVTTLNIYLSTIIDVLLKHDATINKFGGDSIMAIWNVPAPCENHTLVAVKAAKEAQGAIECLQENNPGLPKMSFGIGINTGIAVAGNMGSQDRLEYTVIGDTVNLAARLTDVTPGAKVWIGSHAFELVKGHIKAKSLHALELKGKQEPLQAYEVIEVINNYH